MDGRVDVWETAKAVEMAMLPRRGGRSEMSVHQQTGFAASTVTDDDQLSADFGHGF